MKSSTYFSNFDLSLATKKIGKIRREFSMPKWSSIDFDESKDDMKTNKKLIMDATEEGNYKNHIITTCIIIDMKKIAHTYSVNELRDLIRKEIYQESNGRITEELMVSKLEKFDINSSRSIHESNFLEDAEFSSKSFVSSPAETLITHEKRQRLYLIEKLYLCREIIIILEKSIKDV